MNITLNGSKKTLKDIASLSALLEDLSLDTKTVVVELNNEIIQPGSYDGQMLTENDSVEIIRFVGGG
jgi:thiamine biosynthesis protein ThiS